jgi:hypothetical protein
MSLRGHNLLNLISKSRIVPSRVIHRVKNFRSFFVWNRTEGLRLLALNFSLEPAFSGGRSMMNKFTLSATEEQWRQQAESARQEAETLPFGRRREALVREARRLRTASKIDQWLSSSELQPPK